MQMSNPETPKKWKPKVWLMIGAVALIVIAAAVVIPIFLLNNDDDDSSDMSSAQQESRGMSFPTISPTASPTESVEDDADEPTKAPVIEVTSVPTQMPSDSPSSAPSIEFNLFDNDDDNSTTTNTNTTTDIDDPIDATIAPTNSSLFDTSNNNTSTTTVAPSPALRAPSLAPTTGVTTLSPMAARTDGFRLKMLWENGYYWQNERFETYWCIECAECPELTFDDNEANCTARTECYERDQVWIRDCRPNYFDNGGHRFDLLPIQEVDEDFNDHYGIDVSTFYMIKIQDLYNNNPSLYDLCFERLRRYIIIRRCDETNIKQHWAGFNNTVTQDDGTITPPSSFEIYPRDFTSDNDGNEKYCVTQQHHPKEYEIVGLKTCELAHHFDTGYWQFF